MPLRTQILASQINNLSDARYFAAYPVDWMSFVGNPNASNYLDLEQVNEIIGWIAGPKILMDARGCSPAQIQTFVNQVQVSGLIIDATQTISAELQEHYEILRVIYVPALIDLSALEAEIVQMNNNDILVYDFQTNDADTSVVLQPEFAPFLTSRSVFIDGQISIKEVSRFLNSGANGLVITSGVEEKVGLRSFEDIQDLMEELEIEE